MKIFLFIGLLTAVPQFVFAQEESAGQTTAQVSPEIIEIRKSLPMEPTEKAVKDFILNRGSSAGLKVGAYVNVVREVSVNDPVRNKALGALHIPVGKLQIIHVESNISVARLQSELGDDERPMLEYEALMIGDEIDLNSITMDTPKASKKKFNTAATEEKSAVAEQAAQVAKAAPVAKDPVVQAVAALPAPAPVEQTTVSSVTPAETSGVQPSKTDSLNEPAFIITPIENEETPVKEKTSFIPTESATVTAATAAN